MYHVQTIASNMKTDHKQGVCQVESTDSYCLLVARHVNFQDRHASNAAFFVEINHDYSSILSANMSILITLFGVGLILGFVGAGGAGVVIAVLSSLFQIPLHTALATSLCAMVFTTMAGSLSHFREDNVDVRTGATVGGFGAIGAFSGAQIASLIPAGNLKWLTAGMMFISGLLLWVRFFANSSLFSDAKQKQRPSGTAFWLTAAGLGFVTGTMSGAFGIGSTPFIQLGLLTLFGMSVYKSAGTTMFVILPIALLGGIGYMFAGHLNLPLLLQVTTGLMCGAYLGAKFTRRLPPIILKTASVVIPILGGLMLISR